MRINVRNDTRDMQKKFPLRSHSSNRIRKSTNSHEHRSTYIVQYLYFLCTSTNCPFVSVSLNLIEFHACPFDYSRETILRKIATRNPKSIKFELTKDSVKFQLKRYWQLIAVVRAFRELIYIFAYDTTYFRETRR